MKKKDRKELAELAKNPNGGVIGALRKRGNKYHVYKQGTLTNEDINDLVEQLSKEKFNGAKNTL